MALIQQIQQLSVEKQTQLMQDLHAKYPDSLELTNAYTQLIVWIQEQPWEEASDPNNPDHCLKAKALMDKANEQLQSQGNFQGIMMAQALIGSKYQEHPITFVLALQELNKFMISLVEKFTMKEAASKGIAALSVDDDDAMEQGTVNDPIDDITKDLEAANKESQDNEELSKTVEQLKEQYIILFTEKSAEIAQLEVHKRRHISNCPGNKEAEQIKQMEQRINANKQELTSKGNELTVTKRLALYNRLAGHLKQLQQIQNVIIAEISKWTGQQQRSLSGWPNPPPLDNLQPLCELHADLLCRLYQHIIKLDSMFRPALTQDEGEIKRIDNLKSTSKTLLSHFLNKCFVIEKHPPQVLKTNTKFGTTLRHLIGGRLNAHIHPPEVICTLVSEKYVRSLYDAKGKINPPPNDKNILNNKKAMEYNQKSNTFSVEFKNLSVTRANRQGGKKEESVCEEKRCLQFVSEINIGRERFTIMTLSFPTVITVHGNQYADAEATIIWDNSFSAKDRKPFEVPEKITWSQLSEALSNRWTLCNDRELTDENLLYIAGKLFPGVEKEDFDDQVVTRSMFCKEHIHGRNFTFWKWFFSILDVVKKNMLDEWRDGVIHGFINKQEAQDLLINLQPGTFLVRFSDSELGGVTIAYTYQHPTGEKEVWNLSPWTNQHLGMRRFSDRIKDIDSLVILFPGQLKDEAFSRYYSQDENATLLAPGEYRDTVLATRVLGAPGTSTPMVQSPMHPGSQGSLDMISHHALGIPSSPPSICGETDLNIGGEEIVTSELDCNEEAMGILSNVTALMSGQQGLDPFAAAAGFQSGPPAFTPHTIAEEQWNGLSNSY